jgi:hypothetical protein
MKNQILSYLLRLLLILTLLGFMNFISCSGDDESPTEPQKVTVTGTLNLPEAAEGKIWAVLFDNDVDGENGFVHLGTGTCPSGTEVSYSVGNVTTGSYFLYAVVFVVGDMTEGPTYGDFIGIYGGEYLVNMPTSPNAQVSSSNKTFDIDLVVIID